MRRLTALVVVMVGFLGMNEAAVLAQKASAMEKAGCEALRYIRNLTVVSSEIAETESGVEYCYVRGVLPPAIHFHVQLPFPRNWNGRFLQWGDGGKDGDLDFADHRVGDGYAVANSNTGHDNGAEPGSSFGHNNRQAEIDFGYRAVHLTVMAAKTLVQNYFGKAAEYSYFEGCSTGGRQGLMAAQRYPADFDGIVAGAPANYYQEMNAVRVWLLQRMFRDNLKGALGFDTDSDGRLDSTRKINILAGEVLKRCDVIDGIADGVIDDPSQCDFDGRRDLADVMCAGNVDGDDCFTVSQVQTVLDFYEGPRSRTGRPIYSGKPLGSELQWASLFVPHLRNAFFPTAVRLGGDHLNYLFYEEDPGVAPMNLIDLTVVPDSKAIPPEWAWWQFDINDVITGKGDFMMGITDATNPDLSRFLKFQNGRLIVYHGWADALVAPQPTVDYYRAAIDVTYDGNVEAMRETARLFMVPGMAHCRGGAGPDTWDRLLPLVDWVERGAAPDSIIATHSTGGVVDNERPICAFPERAVYSGPSGGSGSPTNWIAENFSCR